MQTTPSSGDQVLHEKSTKNHVFTVVLTSHRLEGGSFISSASFCVFIVFLFFFSLNDANDFSSGDHILHEKSTKTHAFTVVVLNMFIAYLGEDDHLFHLLRFAYL